MFTWVKLLFVLTFGLTLNFVDDRDYQRAFAALDELNLASLKQFFKENYLQVLKSQFYCSVFMYCFYYSFIFIIN